MAQLSTAELPLYRHTRPLVRVGALGTLTARGARFAPGGGVAPHLLPERPLRVATWPGEGVVFLTRRALWLAPSFMGEPKGIAPLVSGPRAGIFVRDRTLMVLGASFDRASGKTWAPPLPLGATHQVVLDDKIRAATFFGGTLAKSADGGLTWTAGSVVAKKDSDAFAEALQAWLAKQPGVRKLSDFKLLPARRSAALPWSRGDAIDKHRALLVKRNQVWVWDARTGTTKAVEHSTLAKARLCQARAVHGATLLGCIGFDGRPSVYAYDALAGLHRERRGGSGARLFAAGARLAMTGSCEHDDDAAACIRGHDGTWRTVRPAQADPGKALRVVPIADDAAVFVTNQGILWGPEAQGFRALDRRASKALRAHADRAIDDAWALGDDGALHGWANWQHRAAPAVVVRTGKLEEPTPMATAVRWSGTRGLAERRGQLIQSTDFGVSWEAVGKPPDLRWRLGACGPLGCELGDWQRIGWRAAAGRSPKLLRNPSGPGAPIPQSQAKLRCVARKGARSKPWKGQPPGIRFEDSTTKGGFIRTPYTWVDEFDVRGRVHTTTLRVKEEAEPRMWRPWLGLDARGAAVPYLGGDCRFGYPVGASFRVAPLPASSGGCPIFGGGMVRAGGAFHLHLRADAQAGAQPSQHWRLRGRTLKLVQTRPFEFDTRDRLALDGRDVRLLRKLGYDDWVELRSPPQLPRVLPGVDKLVPATDKRCKRGGPRMSMHVPAAFSVGFHQARERRRVTQLLVRFSGGMRCVEAANVWLGGERRLVARWSPRREAAILDVSGGVIEPQDCTWEPPPSGAP